MALAVAGVVVDGVLLHDTTVGGELPATPDSLASFTGARARNVVVAVLALVAAAEGAQLATEAQLADNLTFTGARTCRVVVAVPAVVAGAEGMQLTDDLTLTDSLTKVLFVVGDVISMDVIVLAPMIVGKSGGFVTISASTAVAGETTVNVVECAGLQVYVMWDLVVGSSYVLHRLHV